jgi:hypothetical protein
MGRRVRGKLEGRCVSSAVNCGQDRMTSSRVSPSAMLPTITLIGTRVHLMHGLP